MWLFMDRMMGDWDPNQTCSVSTFLGCGCRRAGGGGGGGIRPTFLWGSLSIPRLARRDQGEIIASLVSIQMDIPWTSPMDLHASWPDAVAPRLASLNVMGGKDPPWAAPECLDVSIPESNHSAEETQRHCLHQIPDSIGNEVTPSRRLRALLLPISLYNDWNRVCHHGGWCQSIHLLSCHEQKDEMPKLLHSGQTTTILWPGKTEFHPFQTESCNKQYHHCRPLIQKQVANYDGGAGISKVWLDFTPWTTGQRKYYLDVSTLIVTMKDKPSITKYTEMFFLGMHCCNGYGEYE